MAQCSAPAPVSSVAGPGSILEVQGNLVELVIYCDVGQRGIADVAHGDAEDGRVADGKLVAGRREGVYLLDSNGRNWGRRRPRGRFDGSERDAADLIERAGAVLAAAWLARSARSRTVTLLDWPGPSVPRSSQASNAWPGAVRSGGGEALTNSKSAGS